MNWKRPFRAFSVNLKPRAPSTCPKCDAAVTDMVELGPHRPQPGSYTICWNCDEFLRFGTNLKLRSLTDADKFTLDVNPSTRAELDLLRIQIVISRRQNFRVTPR